MTKQTFRKQRGGGSTGGDDSEMKMADSGDSFSGSSIRGGRKHRRKHHTKRKHKRHTQ